MKFLLLIKVLILKLLVNFYIYVTPFCNSSFGLKLGIDNYKFSINVKGNLALLKNKKFYIKI